MQGNNQTRLLKPLLTQSTKLSAHNLNIYLPISYANNPLHISANLINRPSQSDQSLFSALTTAEKPSLIWHEPTQALPGALIFNPLVSKQS